MAGYRAGRRLYAAALLASRQGPCPRFDRRGYQPARAEGRTVNRMPREFVQPKAPADTALGSAQDRLGIRFYTADPIIPVNRSAIVLSDIVTIVVDTNPPPALTVPLSNCFGAGASGWLERDVPVNTMIDFVSGRVVGMAGAFIRSPSSGRWARAN